jgi:hypothetical protein
MQFHNPNFLWALWLLIIPVVIHLFNFRKYKKVVFSNVDMLKQIKTQSQKTRQIKKWIVLLTRMLALAALVIAFSRPYVPLGGKTEGKMLYSLYLDNSNSMNATSEQGQLFENAKNTSRSIVENLPKTSDVQIIDNRFGPSSSKILTPQNSVQIIDNLEITNHPNHLNLAIQKAQSKYNNEGYDGLKMFVISDLQKNFNDEVKGLDSNTMLYMFRSEAANLQNLSIDTVWLVEPITKLGDPVKLSIRLSNNGSDYIESATLNLSVNQTQHGLESFEMEGNSEIVLDMAFVPNKAGWLSGKLSINDVPVVYDNDYYFTLNIKEKLHVLELGNHGKGLFKIFGQDRAFNLTTQSSGAIDYGSLPSYDFIVVNEMESISSGLAEQLSQYVEKGGALCIIPPINNPQYNELTNVLPIQSYGAIKNKNLSLNPSDLNHPFFKDLFTTIPQNNFLPRVKKCYNLMSRNRSQPLLSLKDGSLILSKTPHNKGVVYQFGMSMDESFSNFIDDEIYVLSMLKMAFSKSSKQRLSSSLTTADAIDLPYFLEQSEVVTLQKEKQEIIVESSFVNGSAKIWLNNTLQDPGVYKVLNGEREVRSFCALNTSRIESKQEYYSDEELKEMYGESAVEMLISSVVSVAEITTDISEGKSLWKVFIILSLIFLLVEILLLRFIKS